MSLAFFQRRLATAQSASELPASARFDLAFSDMDDDTLEDTVGMFGGPEPGSGGFGMTDVLNEFLSRDPKFVPVSSLGQYQQNLKDMGYLDPTYPVTGAWDELSNSASRRAERDATDLIRSGAHLGSVTVQKGLGYLAAAVPQEIFKGVWGAVKGTAENVARFATNPLESAEEAGALGGAGAGALVGWGVGGPFGALIGGAAGGVFGFAADFFDWGGEDNDPEGSRAIWDALTPYDEYRETGAKNFFAMIDTIMLASVALKAGQVGIKGVQGALKATSTAPSNFTPAVNLVTRGNMVTPVMGIQQGTRTVAQAGFREAFRRAAPGTAQVGLVNKMTQAALSRPVRGGAALGAITGAAPDLLAGEWGEALEGGLTGAVVGAVTLGALSKTKQGAKAIDKTTDLLKRAPLASVTESGAGQVLRAGYTSAAMVSTGGRIVSDITPGKDAVEKGIEEAPDWGKAGDAIDLTVGSLLYPNRILPIRPREIGDAFRAMDNTHALMPFYRAQAQLDKSRVDDNLIRKVDSALGLGDPSDRLTVTTNAYRMYLDKAADQEAHRLAQMEMPPGTGDSILTDFRFRQLQRTKRAQVVKQMTEESENGPSSLASRLLEDSLNAPLTMENEVLTWQGRGTSIDNLAEETQAQRLLDEGSPEGEFRVMPALADSFLTSQRVTGMRTRYEQAVEGFREAKTLSDGNPGNRLLTDQAETAYQDLDSVIGEIRSFDLIDEADNITMRQNLTEANQTVVKRLDEIAAMQPAENAELSEVLRSNGLDRYIAINTGENMLVASDVPRLLEYEGIGQVVRHPVREFLASMARNVDDHHDLGPMRYRSIVSQLQLVSDRRGLDMTGEQMADTLYDFVRNRSKKEWAERNLGENITEGRVFIRREDLETGKARKELFKMDPRDLRPDDINKAFKLDELVGRNGEPLFDDTVAMADEIKRAVSVGAAFGADMHHPLATLRELGRSLQIQGLPAFQDFARTVRAPLHKWTGQTEKRFDELTGFSGKAAKGSWGYVPENLRRIHLAFQFSLSPSFDISRYVESMSFGARYGISPRLVARPKPYIHANFRHLRNPFDGSAIEDGKQAVEVMNQWADHVIYGRNTAQSLDDLQFRANNAGIAGFKPREVEAAQALVLAQRKMKNGPLSSSQIEDLREELLTINRYGKGQSAYAKSAHFIFFPFLFQAKQLNLIQDTVLGAPTRAALMHEGFRRWYGIDGDEGMKKRFGEEVVEKHLPILKELARWNNLSYGIGAGRFFLDGLLDTTSVDGRAALDRSTHGKIAQGLTQFFLPGGIHTPVGESAGQLSEWAKHLFMPVVIYDDGEQVSAFDEFKSVLDRSIPAFRDAQRWFDENQNGVIWEQLAVATDPTHTTTSAQFTEYLDNRSLLRQTFEQLAVGAGYSSWDSLRQSDAGAELSALYDQGQDMLRGEYPSGAELATKFVDTDESRKVALVSIANKEHRTDAEEAIMQLGLLEETVNQMAADKGVSQETMRQHVAPLIRQFGLSMVEDRQFLNLWENLGYQSTYGPLRIPVAA